MKKWMYNTLIIIFAAVFVVSAGYLTWYFINAGKQANRYNELEALRTQETTPRPTVDEEKDIIHEELEPIMVEVTDPETGEKVMVLSDFAQLYTMNNDIVGWMSIPGTTISYPVMQTPDNVDYYLKRNFDKEYSAHGSLYAREQCDVFAPSDNITIYGHHMKDGSMFAGLDNYLEQSFFEENPYIYFDTLTELHTYKILAVFKTSAVEGKGFPYHRFVNAKNEAEFDKFVDTCKDLAFYDTKVDAQYGDKLICLSTCEYTLTNGRLVVVAKRID